MAVKIGVYFLAGVKRPIVRDYNGRLYVGDTVDRRHKRGQGGVVHTAMTMDLLIRKIDQHYAKIVVAKHQESAI